MRALAAVLLLLSLVVAPTVGRSGASFTATAPNPQTFATAADFNTVAVSMTDPGTAVRGAATLSATATSDRGITSVAFQVAAAGTTTWTAACTDTSAPYSCAWDTTAVADGLKDVRAVATDAAGYTRAAVVASRRVDNTAPSGTLADPGSPLRATVALSGSVTDAGSGVASVLVQVRPSGGATWTDACSAATASCSWNSTSLADGLYDFRLVATDAAGNTGTSAVVTSRRVDNTAPATATLTNPGTPLQGSVTLSGGATDTGSGVASVRFQYAATGTTAWTDACVDSTAPYSCAWPTTGVADAVYDLRTLATDAAGNTLASTTLTARRVDNAGPTVAVTDPGAYLRATPTVAATASDPAGVQSVAIQYRLSPSGAWQTICTDSTSPYSCSWATTGLADGGYDLQAVATDTLGHASTSAVLAARTVDNTAPRGSAIEGANGGTAGKMDANDTLTFTFSEAIAPASLSSGFTGASTAVTVRVTDGGTRDLVSVWNGANTAQVNLTSATQDLQLMQNWVTGAVVFNATMTQSAAQVVVKLGTVRSGTPSTGVTGTTAMSWTPSAGASDLAGNPAATTAVTESGTADRDF